MSVVGIMRTVLWTEISEALRKDFPEMNIPTTAPENLAKVIKANVDDFLDVLQKSSKGQRK